jgi:superfamily I DNA/RNA helicase
MKNYLGNLETTCLGPDGRKPQTIVVLDDEDERAKVTEVISRLVKEEQVPASSITILTPKAKGKSKWREGEKLGGFSVTWEIGAYGLFIQCSTIHAFKGLESPVIILSEMIESDQTYLRQLAYVGSSRAKSHLILIKRNG